MPPPFRLRLALLVGWQKSVHAPLYFTGDLMNATSLIRAAAALAFAGASTFAADITGKWHGTIVNTKFTDLEPVDFRVLPTWRGVACTLLAGNDGHGAP